MKEVWKEIEGFDGRYKISNFGNVFSMSYKATKKPKMLKPNINVDGYCELSLVQDGKRARRYVHRLVAEAFIPNPENKPFINHIDYNRSNNIVTNLEWCTAAENTHHSLNRILPAAIAASSKAVIQFDLDGNVVAEYESLSEASRQTKINCGHICQCAKGHEKTAGGFKWKYRGQANGQ